MGRPEEKLEKLEPLEPGFYVVGLGIPEKAAATVEAIDVLRRADVVFATDPNDRFFGLLCKDVRSFGDIGSTRGPQATRAAAKRVAEEAGPGKSVAFAIYGHPLLFEPVVAMVIEEARGLGRQVKVVPGISALDASLALLGEAIPPDGGLLVGDIEFFLRNDPRADCALFVYKAGMVPKNLARLLARLAESRGKKARVAVVEGRNFSNSRETASWATLDALSREGKIPYYASLFLPGPTARS